MGLVGQLPVREDEVSETDGDVCRELVPHPEDPNDGLYDECGGLKGV